MVTTTSGWHTQFPTFAARRCRVCAA